MTAIIDASEKPELSAVLCCRAAVAELKTKRHGRSLLILMPSFERGIQSWLTDVGANRAFQTAIAAERFRLATGRWPQSLVKLTPTYLDEVPIDPFDGRAIRFKRTNEGIKTWTIGEDLHDDEGDVRRVDQKRKPPDQGWVILNPELRGRSTGQ